MKPKIGIIGAGVMGKGVAERFANYGYQVILLDNDDKVASKVISDITRSIKMKKMFDKTLNEDDIVANIKVARDYFDFKTVDFIVENIVEQEEAKKSVYKQVDEE
ncbi:3-hydroxyacyl-CoA dehydrogenase NAD-binding domain-containing protein [Streptococcus troglodytae]|uniref:Putative 3-hydroxybutyryl-CoA dehydrogenase n=1 Tax=Streptococcus troglodytae TaxID=1111760 RepID=A0A1L7LM46_9STRE|nr:3-hydroxyacyl-CoA dehydrogenase NAD-binding domain-containing protein [Streptococcus troglodytae]BAQ25236.1 putative 3-hydroxybutyryl-CoA dehydrogenase [Streptococcus troglodytae]